MECLSLANYPLVILRVVCRYRSRRGFYNVARLTERYGAGLKPEELANRLEATFREADDRRPGQPCGGVHFPDIATNRSQRPSALNS